MAIVDGLTSYYFPDANDRATGDCYIKAGILSTNRGDVLLQSMDFVREEPGTRSQGITHHSGLPLFILSETNILSLFQTTATFEKIRQNSF